MLNSLKCLQKSTSILYWAWIAWISLLVSLCKSWPCRANALVDLETLACRDIGKMSKGHIGFITMHKFIWTHAYRHSGTYGRMGKPNNLTTLEVSESPKPISFGGSSCETTKTPLGCSCAQLTTPTLGIVKAILWLTYLKWGSSKCNLDG
jgi:hypothetical protein